MTDRRKGERRDLSSRPVFPKVGYAGEAFNRLYAHSTRYNLVYPRVKEDVQVCLKFVADLPPEVVHAGLRGYYEDKDETS